MSRGNQNQPLPNASAVCQQWLSMAQVGPGTQVRIRQLNSSPELAARLREMGFCEFAVVRLGGTEDNLICHVCGARVALSQQLAHLILVETMPKVQLG